MANSSPLFSHVSAFGDAPLIDMMAIQERDFETGVFYDFWNLLEASKKTDFHDVLQAHNSKSKNRGGPLNSPLDSLFHLFAPDLSEGVQYSGTLRLRNSYLAGDAKETSVKATTTVQEELRPLLCKLCFAFLLLREEPLWIDAEDRWTVHNPDHYWLHGYSAIVSEARKVRQQGVSSSPLLRPCTIVSLRPAMSIFLRPKPKPPLPPSSISESATAGAQREPSVEKTFGSLALRPIRNDPKRDDPFVEHDPWNQNRSCASTDRPAEQRNTSEQPPSPLFLQRLFTRCRLVAFAWGFCFDAFQKNDAQELMRRINAREHTYSILLSHAPLSSFHSWTCKEILECLEIYFELADAFDAIVFTTAKNDVRPGDLQTGPWGHPRSFIYTSGKDSFFRCLFDSGFWGEVLFVDDCDRNLDAVRAVHPDIFLLQFEKNAGYDRRKPKAGTSEEILEHMQYIWPHGVQ